MSVSLDSIGRIGRIAQHGSPLLINSMGRLFGLGETEQQALAKGEFPRWAIFVLGIGAGLAAGVFAQRRWPATVSKVTGV